MSLKPSILRHVARAVYLAILLVLALVVFRVRPGVPYPACTTAPKTFTVHPGYVSRSADYTLTAEIHGS